MSTFIIRNKSTLEQWVASSGKRSWNKSHHAKAAFAYSRSHTKNNPLLSDYYKNISSSYESLKFNDQDVYEVVELYSNAEIRSANIERALKTISDKLTDLKSTLNSCSENLSLEEYDILYGDIEELQKIAHEAFGED
ncbi:hypothetical protein VPHG_00175 [Vibrio phage 11895-B1]|uniref:hypothetical protein n=1 Tax=Vibrio phage 11895-B1 TaxID=754075 RepID=UPI0002C12D8B|nr:hypothetical protein VPHG_00175 [Vibrio phage 11895-B1]AGH32238.1 hypothetical protein VPHG_00175 [Vibrio phage 11895-B1]